MDNLKEAYLAIENNDETRLLLQKDTCDKYDYLVAVGCGAIGGLIDIFLVGSPTDSVLQKKVDIWVDDQVMRFAKSNGWNPNEGEENSVANAIDFLEKKFKVNYDQRHTADVNGLFDMSTKNHHMKSLSHCPDIIGLFFSILNQFTSTSSFLADGKIITVETETFELKGGNFIAKIFCGIANWFGHLMSDIAGSSESRGNAGRGSGIVMPFYELFGVCKFGHFSVGKDKQDLAIIATRAFQEGYDFRFGITLAIPVVITDLSIRLIWSIRNHFQYGRSLMDCIPSQKHDDLRVMLLLGNGTLCVMDGIDAGIRGASTGNFLVFFTRLNFVAWFRFVMLVIKEVSLRVGIDGTIEAFKRVNEYLHAYLLELEKIDIKAFEQETAEYNNFIAMLNSTSTNEELNAVLTDIYEKMAIQKPWEGDFSEHMANKNGTLIFE